MLRRYGVVSTDVERTSDTSTRYYRYVLTRRFTRNGADRALSHARRRLDPRAGEMADEPRYGWWYQPGYEVVDLATMPEQERRNLNGV